MVYIMPLKEERQELGSCTAMYISYTYHPDIHPDNTNGLQAQRETERILLVDHWLEIWVKDLTYKNIRLCSSTEKGKYINQWLWVCIARSFIQIGKHCISSLRYLSFFYSYPLKRSISKLKWHFEMKCSSSFWKCWYKEFWHFLKPFPFICACVYEDYLRDETWPYKFILVDRTIQVEV